MDHTGHLLLAGVLRRRPRTRPDTGADTGGGGRGSGSDRVRAGRSRST
ncbi:hypothetical protein [Pseudonocardia kunmingensis]|nr:hypothetical protein [Pseudonocardia kunmingensis]